MSGKGTFRVKKNKKAAITGIRTSYLNVSCLFINEAIETKIEFFKRMVQLSVKLNVLTTLQLKID